mmetsp:Transcript_12284/g.40351  ORF Transcript_12284/g.40351 Transcript_12284/m.40351 type:complete len:176 (-) Transcript_12284:343-870(-)
MCKLRCSRLASLRRCCVTRTLASALRAGVQAAGTARAALSAEMVSKFSKTTTTPSGTELPAVELRTRLCVPLATPRPMCSSCFWEVAMTANVHGWWRAAASSAAQSARCVHGSFLRPSIVAAGFDTSSPPPRRAVNAQVAQYCSQACQAHHWGQAHKRECARLRATGLRHRSAPA